MSSILEVAEKAGVAPSTVSLVANGKPRVSAATRKRVKSAIKQLNWQPRSANSGGDGRSANYASHISSEEKNANSKPHHIGVLYGRGMVLTEGLVDYCRKWVMGIQESFSSGAVISVYQGVDHIDNDLMFGRNLQKKDFDGVVLMGVRPEDGYLDKALNSGVRTIVMNQRSDHGEFSSIRADGWAGGQLAARHLQNLGHDKVGILIVSDDPTHEAYSLHSGFMETARQENMQLVYDKQDNPKDDLNDLKNIKKVAKQLIARGATACFTGDPVGLRLANAMEEVSIKVPQDFSILGWDDLGYITDSGKKLSSIGYSKNTMGLMAGRMLQNLFDMNGDITSLAATVPVKLNNGATTSRAGLALPEKRAAHEMNEVNEVSGQDDNNLSPYQQLEQQNNNKQKEPELVEV